MKGPRAGVRATALTAWVALAAVHCGRTTSPNAPASTSAASAAASGPGVQAAEDDAGPMDERERQAWTEAEAGEPQELMRLTDRVGCETLQERASDPSRRAAAIRAMAYCPDFMQLPWLAEVAVAGHDDEAILALQAIVDQAAQPRLSTDPEDADELHEGCGTLLGLARLTERPRARRVIAVSALRMLAERGCVARAEIPTDLDAK